MLLEPVREQVEEGAEIKGNESVVDLGANVVESAGSGQAEVLV